MKVAISASADTLDSAVDPRFGRAARFILFDTETGAFEAHGNDESLGAGHGAGIQAAQAVARLGAQAVITGHCGPNAMRVLRAAGIAVLTFAGGTVAQAIDAYRAGALVSTESADVRGHWK